MIDSYPGWIMVIDSAKPAKVLDQAANEGSQANCGYPYPTKIAPVSQSSSNNWLYKKIVVKSEKIINSLIIYLSR